LASVAAQLLGFFKADDNFGPRFHSKQGARDFLVASCYMALFLNISATIGSFVLIDALGEIGFRASKNSKLKDLEKAGTIETTQDRLLEKYGASSWWQIILWHCQFNRLVLMNVAVS